MPEVTLGGCEPLGRKTKYHHTQVICSPDAKNSHVTGWTPMPLLIKNTFVTRDYAAHVQSNRSQIARLRVGTTTLDIF